MRCLAVLIFISCAAESNAVELRLDSKRVAAGASQTAGAAGFPLGNAAAGAPADKQILEEIEDELRADTSLMLNAQVQMVHFAFGILLVAVSVAVQFVNEERSAKMGALLVRGRSECLSVPAEHPEEENRGRLVHVQGTARAARPLADSAFQGARVEGCLKLQSTVEVFEWTQTIKTRTENGHMYPQTSFHAEWTTIHRDSLRFRKPSPENPRLPKGLTLGTRTQTCDSVKLGGFVLSDDILVSFHRFEPAMSRLPDRLTSASGHVFVANRQDGYYYMRPWLEDSEDDSFLWHHEAGDVRARFMCVLEGDATVVGVQSESCGGEGLLPYRVVPQAPWITQLQERQRRLDEGTLSRKELRRQQEQTCFAGGGASTCCCRCICSLISLLNEEIVTEEIFFVSDRLESRERAFRWVVQRNPCRVWNFRLLGLATMLIGVGNLALHLSAHIHSSLIFKVYGGLTLPIFVVMASLAISTFVMAAAHLCYRPLLAVQWLVSGWIIVASPFVGARLAHPS